MPPGFVIAAGQTPGAAAEWIFAGWFSSAATKGMRKCDRCTAINEETTRNEQTNTRYNQPIRALERHQCHRGVSEGAAVNPIGAVLRTADSRIATPREQLPRQRRTQMSTNYVITTDHFEGGWHYFIDDLDRSSTGPFPDRASALAHAKLRIEYLHDGRPVVDSITVR
jgi:hypothetical protein